MDLDDIGYELFLSLVKFVGGLMFGRGVFYLAITSGPFSEFLLPLILTICGLGVLIFAGYFPYKIEYKG